MYAGTDLALRLRPAPGFEVLWLGDAAASDAAVTGGKAANLSRLASGFRVPPGFVLSGPPSQRPRVAALRAAYGRLAELTGVEEPVVAVRSSAVDEDGADASFAGQHDTYLGVAGLDALGFAVAETLGSFTADRALDYRRARGLGELPERVAVLVQWLVPADVAGVVFSANPVTGERGEVVINASFGLGESVVDGTVTPDTWVFERPGLRVRGHHVADKRRMTVRVAGGTRTVPVPARLASLPALDEARALEAARLAVALEREMGHPVDVEVAWQGFDLHVLQCRPITTLPGGDHVRR